MDKIGGIVILEHIIETIVPFFIHILEIMGIFILIIGAVKAFYHYFKGLFIVDPYALKYHFANAMAMALEFKLAAEILKTVIVRNIDEIIMLGAIVLLRLVMTFVIRAEMKDEVDVASNTQELRNLKEENEAHQKM
ncbi:DUF1622 domain-containing protein [Candidatus Epulonipiscium viviparus]|uniref:DUF1622 domain-containing protein n=2 Tax=Candidatus Epulonipiscium viviparus TaxID=420336 RepID=UPI00016BFE12|nr:DUF1622 domain-containing protein [Candidatus Epulopiscium viviparus]